MSKQPTRAGYEYQDLIALNELLNLYDKKDFETFIVVENSDPNFKSLDDITVIFSDGKYKLIQSKCTTSNEQITWEWLTKHINKGTSNLFKWQKRVNELIFQNVEFDAYLYTNRCFDDCMCNFVKERKILWDLLPKDMQNALIKQESDKNRWIAFFDNFEFITDYPSYDEYAALTEIRVNKLSKNLETYSFVVDNIRQRSISKGDRKISLENFNRWVQGRFDRLRQNFSIPNNYQIPDEGFYNDFIKRINEKERLIVLKGEPAIGKSTFLSKIIEDLKDDKDKIIIRHHYFLSISEFDSNFQTRLQYLRVLNDFAQQLGIDEIKKIPYKLKEFVGADLHPIIIIDGLDHVERTAHFFNELEQLIHEVCNYPTGITIILGTQPLKKYPEEINTEIANSSFVDMPHMNLTAIKGYLLSDDFYKKINPQFIEEIVEVLKRKTLGNPEILHLFIEIIKASSTKGQINKYDIEDIPAYGGNINNFYSAIIGNFSSASRYSLKNIGCINFKVWNNDIIIHLLTRANYSVDDIEISLKEISKFFSYSHLNNIFVIRHESFLLYLRSLVNSDEKTKYLSLVLEYLQSLDNSNYWKIAYTPIISIELNNLDINVDRQFLVSCLSKGYTEIPTLSALETLEEKFLERKDYSNLYRVRHKKTRLYNIEFNLADDRVNELTLLLMRDSIFFELILNNIVDSGFSCLELGRAIYRKKTADAEAITLRLLDRVIKEYNDSIKFKSDINNYSDYNRLNGICELFVICNKIPNIDFIIGNSFEYFVIEKSIQYKKTSPIKAVLKECDISTIDDDDDERKLGHKRTYLRYKLVRIMTEFMKLEGISSVLYFGISEKNLEFINTETMFFAFFENIVNSKLINFEKKKLEEKIAQVFSKLYKDDTRIADFDIDNDCYIDEAYLEYFLYYLTFDKDIYIKEFSSNFIFFNVLFRDLKNFAQTLKNRIKNIEHNQLIIEFIKFYQNLAKRINHLSNQAKNSFLRRINNSLVLMLRYLSLMLFNGFSQVKLATFSELIDNLDIHSIIIYNNFDNMLMFNKECLEHYIKKINHFDEIVYINDIIYQQLDVVELLTYIGDYEEAQIMLNKAYQNGISLTCSLKKSPL